MFNFDVKDLKWPAYVEQYYYGTKKFLLNENMDDLNRARKKLAK
jgi:fatty acyl-CoA reductase